MDIKLYFGLSVLLEWMDWTFGNVTRLLVLEFYRLLEDQDAILVSYQIFVRYLFVSF